MHSEELSYTEGNKHFRLISIRELVSDPQFQSGYRDRLQGRPPRRFFLDEGLGYQSCVWGFERGRLTATWLLSTGRTPPSVDDIRGLVSAYLAAAAADAVL